jgi:hypothetical protein
MNGPRAGAQIYGRQVFPDPPTVLPLTVGGGGGGSGIRNNEGGSDVRAQIHGSDWIPDPPDRSAFNGGGGSGMLVNYHAQIYG